MLQDHGNHLLGHVLDAGDEVGAQVGGDGPTILLDEVLQQGPAHGLGHRALDLALHLLGVDGLAHVVDAHQAGHTHLARLQVHLYVGHLGAVAVGDVGIAGAGLAIVGSGPPGMEDVLGPGRALLVLPAGQRELRRSLDRAAGHEGHAAGRTAAAGAGDVRIFRQQFDLLRSQSQHLRRDLDHGRVRALAHVRADAADARPFDLCAAFQLHPGVAVFWEAQTEAHVLVAERDASAPGERRGLGDWGIG